MVTNPSRGSLTLRSRVSAAISRIRSANLRARAGSAMGPSSFSRATVVRTPDGLGEDVRVVLVRVKPTPCRQQFDLRAFGDVSLHEVEHFHAAAYVGGHDRHADLGSA